VIIWDGALDPGTLRVVAEPARAGDPDSIDPRALAAWLSISTGGDGHEHAVLSDGRHHLRVDLDRGSLRGGPVLLHYLLSGVADVPRRLLSLRRLLDLATRGQFAASLYPPDPRLDRFTLLLRAHDALTAGATQREIAELLVAHERVVSEWRGSSDSLRSRVRRLVKDARGLAAGGYRRLMGGAPD
jgi:hypothetical protein